jgi:predicted nucleic-acid-binding Zn-ribbon protein
MYGWGIVLVATWQEQVSTGQAPGAPEGVCTPVKTITPEGEAHMNLQKYTNGYSVTVAKNYTVTVTGCGYNETYIMLVQVASYTVNGHDYHVIDPTGRTCGYSDAYLNKTNDIVYCKKNSS